MVSAYTLKVHRLPLSKPTRWEWVTERFILRICHSIRHRTSLRFSWTYSSSLIFLGIFGSVIAFGTYFSLLNQIGPERVAYVFVLTPIIALVLSTLFEDFHWSIGTFAGLFFVLLGNVLALNKKYFSAKKPDLPEIAKELLE